MKLVRPACAGICHSYYDATKYKYDRFHCISNDDIRNGKMTKTIVVAGGRSHTLAGRARLVNVLNPVLG